MIGQKLLNLAGVPPEKLQECMEWAFGTYNDEDPLEALRQRWNAKHADIFICTQNDKPKIFIWSVGKAYVDRYITRKIIVPSRFVGAN